MPLISNHSEETWEFGALLVPPGDSHHSLAAVQEAARTTCLRKHVVMAGSTDWRHDSQFVLLVAGVRSYEELDQAEPAEIHAPDPVALDDKAIEEKPELDMGSDPPAPGRPLHAHSRKELREIAVTMDIKGASKMSKPQALKAIEAHGDAALRIRNDDLEAPDKILTGDFADDELPEV